ncbi:Glutathione S-transferase [Lachnellula suecica]|uniref:Glutathione S-transferase n=1 Tax=Lachnellula suecica TaxID=602035 RepID=A0A8T9BSR2_9HELO|nr:Glutathione S-transferase [Lachnellula suecica]
MSLTIHHLQNSQSERVVWLAEELHIPYTLKLHQRDPYFSPQSIKDLNPLGSAPVIQDGSLTLAESAACVEYIIHKHGNGRLALPPSHKDYADYLYWFHFSNGTFQPHIMQVLQFSRLGGSAAGASAVSARLDDRLGKYLGLMDARLGANKWLAGDEFTAADIMIVFTLTTMRMFNPLDLTEYKGILAYLKRVSERDGSRNQKGGPAHRRAPIRLNPFDATTSKQPYTQVRHKHKHQANTQARKPPTTSRDVSSPILLSINGHPAPKMQLPAGINRRYATFAGFTLILLWLWVAFDRPYKLPANIGWNKHTSVETDAFDIPAVNSQAIRDVCSRTEWNSSLVFTCDNNHGGIGHVRNSILNCVRYAMSAGASLVLPIIALRDMEEPEEMVELDDDMMELGKRHGPGRRSMDYMFDTDHFVASLKLSCPQMKIVKHMEAFYSERRRALRPESLVMNMPTSGIEHPEEWRGLFYDWVEERVATTPKTEDIIIDLEQSFLQYPTHSDGAPFAHAFGSLLKFRPDVRRLATKTLKELADWYDIPLNLSAPILKQSFFGAHLKTTEDEEPQYGKRHVAAAPYTHYAGQATAYLEHASASQLPILYLASGNITSITKLAHQATAFNIDVTHKFQLLKGPDREELEGLKWDQRALVDFLVLLKAEEFAGVGHSSFSWNVALKREREADVKKGKWVDGMWRDGVSTLYGVRESYVDSALCMWE